MERKATALDYFVDKMRRAGDANHHIESSFYQHRRGFQPGSPSSRTPHRKDCRLSKQKLLTIFMSILL
ncbi:hypothetical protein [Paraburkholderia kirstenboschensis]|uniref:hypothetical protein n=1 Tax=Paraburkholderia kirstenboschensis TaxID=1245436 RepID=UPI000B2A7E01|nr:hypothetical protein [Paraburkholderia kirstenboschensis]